MRLISVQEAHMTAVGIGGVFFRADNPQLLQDWYAKNLGVALNDTYQWMQQAGPTVFMPFARDTDYFPAAKQWMINFRVNDLDALISALRKAEVEVITNPDWDSADTGQFARICDPEGNPIELWEPPAV
jgi:glyoxylase I family protein